MGLRSTEGPWAGLLCALPRSTWVPVQGLHRGRTRHTKRNVAVGPSPLLPDPQGPVPGVAQ